MLGERNPGKNQIFKFFILFVTFLENLAEPEWKNFENFVVEIFRSNSFRVKHTMRFKTESRYEIDAVAVRGVNVFCVDCKDWSAGRYKKSALIKAADLQQKRMEEFKKFLWKNLVAKKVLDIRSDSIFRSLIVTLEEEDVVRVDDTFFVPVTKLNSFLNEPELYYD